MPAPRKSLRPRARKKSIYGVGEKSTQSPAVARGNAAAKRRAREEAMTEAMMGMKYGGKVKKMKDGGMCRGMGAATRGGNYKMG